MKLSRRLLSNISSWWQSRPSFQFCHFATWHEKEETNMWCDAWWSSWPKTCFVQRPSRLCFYHHHCRQLAWKTNRSGHSLTYQEKWGNIENEAQLTMPKYRKLKLNLYDHFWLENHSKCRIWIFDFDIFHQFLSY